MHNNRKEHLIKRNTVENQLNVGDPKRFTFEGSDDNIYCGKSENKTCKYSIKEPKINSVQTIFLYNSGAINGNRSKVLTDDSGRHLNTPPSPRFGDASLSFGNDQRASFGQGNLLTEQNQEFQDSFANILKDGSQNNVYSSFTIIKEF